MIRVEASQRGESPASYGELNGDFMGVTFFFLMGFDWIGFSEDPMGSDVNHQRSDLGSSQNGTAQLLRPRVRRWKERRDPSAFGTTVQGCQCRLQRDTVGVGCHGTFLCQKPSGARCTASTSATCPSWCLAWALMAWGPHSWHISEVWCFFTALKRWEAAGASTS
jgi:hypothetical protein